MDTTRLAQLGREKIILTMLNYLSNVPLETILRIKPKRMPERSTYRRILAYKVYEAEIERMVGEYNQSGERGEICALDGKALLGMLKREDSTSEYALSVYDVLFGKTIAQVEVGSPEYPKPGFGKIQTDFLQAQKVNKGHGRIEKRILTTSEMLNSYAAWPGLAQVYRLEHEFQWRRKGVCYKTSCEVEFGITSLSRKKKHTHETLGNSPCSLGN